MFQTPPPAPKWPAVTELTTNDGAAFNEEPDPVLKGRDQKKIAKRQSGNGDEGRILSKLIGTRNFNAISTAAQN
jgi:hypothetical protein